MAKLEIRLMGRFTVVWETGPIEPESGAMSPDLMGALVRKGARDASWSSMKRTLGGFPISSLVLIQLTPPTPICSVEVCLGQISLGRWRSSNGASRAWRVEDKGGAEPLGAGRSATAGGPLILSLVPAAGCRHPHETPHGWALSRGACA
jgi:hypothetical protein